MRKLILRWLGLENVERRAAVSARRPGTTVSQAQLDGFREDTQSLTTAVEYLAQQLDQTVTRDEISTEIDARLKALEAGSASILQGAKNQIRRTREAAWVLWGFLLVFTSFVTIQVHDFHINECMLDPNAGPTKTYVCHAIFPFSQHENIELIHEGLAYVGGFEQPDGHEGDYVIPPQAVGLAVYTLLFGGVGLGVSRYRARTREEQVVEVGEVTPDALDAYAAAQETDPVHFPFPSAPPKDEQP